MSSFYDGTKWRAETSTPALTAHLLVVVSMEQWLNTRAAEFLFSELNL
jgi:hypothetical protein